MNDFEQLEDIWKQAPPQVLPDVALVKQEAKKATKKLSKKLIWHTISLILVIPVLVFVMVNYPFQVWTSYAGLCLMFICIFGIVWFRVKDIRFLKELDYSLAPALLINSYKQFYRQQQWINSKLSLWYSVLLNIAFLLYFYETLWLSTIPRNTKIIFFVCYLVYMLISTLVIAKRYASKQEAAIGKIIESLKAEESHLGEEEK